MLKILLWFVSTEATYLEDAINILEHQHNGVELVGITANAPIQLNKNDKKVNFIPLNKVNGGEFDLLLVVGAKQIGMSNITKAATQLKFPVEKLLGDWIVCIPGFTLDKYRKLQRSRLSIFSINCFGGLICRTLGLPFLSPFINMCLSEDNYMCFLRAPRDHMKEQLVFKETSFNDDLKINFPIVTLGNVDVYMNHYPDFNEAVAKWNERKQRINWYNLFVTAYTEEEEILEQFDALPYGKKVCFVPFKSDLDSAWYINPKIAKHEHLWQKVNNFAHGKPFYYDVFDMLLYGKKTQLIDM